VATNSRTLHTLNVIAHFKKPATMKIISILIFVMVILTFLQCKNSSGKEKDKQFESGNLESISFKDSLYNSIPKDTSERIKVKGLQLSDIDFKQINQNDLGKLINLKGLFYCNCSNLIISNNNPRLKELFIFACKDLKFNPNFSELQNLEKVDIMRCRLNKIPNELCDLKNLKILNVNQNQISELPKEISNLRNIEEFDFSYNDKLVITPDEARIIENNCRNLRRINVIATGMTKEQLDVLSTILENKLIIDFTD
jgi:Leucine-rich repeat (LRR) protein